MALQAGVAKITITPPVGVELVGWGFGPSVGVLNDLEAQALVVMPDQGAPVTIITTDLIGIAVELTQAVRARVAAATGIPASNIMLSASHTHSGPATAYYRGWGAIDAAYIATLESHLVGLVTMAYRNLRPAAMGSGLGHVAGAGANRRSTPAARIDPDVPVVRIDDLNGRTIAVLWNYACHPVSLHSYANLISPDYPGYARSVIRSVLGPDVVVLFTLGAAGDINPSHFRWKQNTPRRSWEMGAILGCEVAKTALTASFNSHEQGCVRAACTSVDLPLAALPSMEDLVALRDNAATLAIEARGNNRPWDEIAPAEIDRDWAIEALELVSSDLRAIPTHQRCELQAIQLGHALLLAMPLELFVETGLAIKAHAPGRLTILTSNSNGTLGYLPTRDAYDVEDYTNPQGRAPKVYGLRAFAVGAEPAIRAAALQLINDFQENAS